MWKTIRDIILVVSAAGAAVIMFGWLVMSPGVYRNNHNAHDYEWFMARACPHAYSHSFQPEPTLYERCLNEIHGSQTQVAIKLQAANNASSPIYICPAKGK